MKQFLTAYKWFQHAQKILIIGQKNWSQDHTAAMSVLEQFLTLEGKTVTLVNQIPAEKSLAFLTNTKSIKPTIGHKNDFVLSIDTSEKAMENMHHVVKDGRVEIIIRGDKNPFSSQDISFKKSAENFDLIVTIGATDLNSLGTPYQQNHKLFSQTPVLNISNNIETEDFGKVNVIEPNESSVCEILYKIFDQNKVPISPEMATTILTGIISQSDSFLSANTSANGLRIAGKLQAIGANQSQIINHLFKEKSFGDLKTLGRILNNFSLANSHRFAYSVLQQSDFSSLGTTDVNIDHWADQVLRHTKNTDLFCLVIEQADGSILTQIRTKTEALNIENLAEEMQQTGIKKRFGLDIIWHKKTNEVVKIIEERLQAFQNNRLNIAPDTEIKFAHIETKNEKNNHQQKKLATSNMTNIPFELEA